MLGKNEKRKTHKEHAACHQQGGIKVPVLQLAVVFLEYVSKSGNIPVGLTACRFVQRSGSLKLLICFVPVN
jgi:hypothetical protein